MQGFTGIDHRPDDAEVAAWVVGKTAPAGPGNSNAVVVDRDHQGAQRAIGSLTRGRMRPTCGRMDARPSGAG